MVSLISCLQYLKAGGQQISNCSIHTQITHRAWVLMLPTNTIAAEGGSKGGTRGGDKLAVLVTSGHKFSPVETWECACCNIHETNYYHVTNPIHAS